MGILPRLSRLETPIYYYRRVYIRRNSVRARVTAALKFVRAAKRAGKNKQESDRLLMGFWMRNCDEALIPDLIQNLKERLKEHRRLLVMCNAVLRKNLRFEMPDEAGSDIEQENN